MHVDTITTAHDLKRELDHIDRVEARLWDDLYAMTIGTIPISGVLRQKLAFRMQQAVDEYRDDVTGALLELGVTFWKD